jgi:hypothetical protein
VTLFEERFLSVVRAKFKAYSAGPPKQWDDDPSIDW